MSGLSDARHRDALVEEDDAFGFSSLTASVLGAPLVISAFLFGLILHDRLQKATGAGGGSRRRDATGDCDSDAGCCCTGSRNTKPNYAKIAQMVNDNDKFLPNGQKKFVDEICSETDADEELVVYEADPGKEVIQPLLNSPM